MGLQSYLWNVDRFAYHACLLHFAGDLRLPWKPRSAMAASAMGDHFKSFKALGEKILTGKKIKEKKNEERFEGNGENSSKKRGKNRL